MLYSGKDNCVNRELIAIHPSLLCSMQWMELETQPRLPGSMVAHNPTSFLLATATSGDLSWRRAKFCHWGRWRENVMPLAQCWWGWTWKTVSTPPPPAQFKGDVKESNRSHGGLWRWLGMGTDVLQDVLVCPAQEGHSMEFFCLLSCVPPCSKNGHTCRALFTHPQCHLHLLLLHSVVHQDQCSPSSSSIRAHSGPTAGPPFRSSLRVLALLPSLPQATAALRLQSHQQA